VSRLIITTVLCSIILSVAPQDNFTLTEIVRNYDPVKDVTTVTLPSKKLSGPKDRYHSLSYSIYFSSPGLKPAPPRDVNFELVSVVKARKLNSDLYVVFVVDGEEIHFSSNRTAIRNPVRGKPWIGERMVFQIPREDFIKLGSAKKLSVKLGDVSFDFTDSDLRTMRLMIDPASDPSIPQQTSPHRL
jgi:hypothetical protein